MDIMPHLCLFWFQSINIEHHSKPAVNLQIYDDKEVNKIKKERIKDFGFYIHNNWSNLADIKGVMSQNQWDMGIKEILIEIIMLRIWKISRHNGSLWCKSIRYGIISDLSLREDDLQV